MTTRRARRLTRDTVLFVAGLAGVAYETLVERIDRPVLLALFGGMIGLPSFLRRDEKTDPPTPARPSDAAPDAVSPEG